MTKHSSARRDAARRSAIGITQVRAGALHLVTDKAVAAGRRGGGSLCRPRSRGGRNGMIKGGASGGRGSRREDPRGDLLPSLARMLGAILVAFAHDRWW